MKWTPSSKKSQWEFRWNKPRTMKLDSNREGELNKSPAGGKHKFDNDCTRHACLPAYRGFSPRALQMMGASHSAYLLDTDQPVTLPSIMVLPIDPPQTVFLDDWVMTMTSEEILPDIETRIETEWESWARLARDKPVGRLEMTSALVQHLHEMYLYFDTAVPHINEQIHK